MNLQELFSSRGVVLADGGMGTQLQARGLAVGEVPEMWNVTHPEAVRAIHADYLSAGSEIVLTNTFGANGVKYHGEAPLAAVVAAGVRLAREAVAAAGGGRLVALDVGPTGKLLRPAGDLSFDEAVESFARTVRAGADAGADLVWIETMCDTRELKAAVLAAKENCSLPVVATVALGEDGKLLTGGTVDCVAALLDGLGVEAYGLNCGLGPEQMVPYVSRLADLTRKPVLAKANAGMPEVRAGATVFPVGPAEFAEYAMRLAEVGARAIGGCCGTTPAHIAALAEALRRRSGAPAAEGDAGGAAFRPRPAPRTPVSSGTGTCVLEPGAGYVIGERINPTGKRLLKEAYRTGDVAYVMREAVMQVNAGAAMLDINCGVPGIDERETLVRTLDAVESVVTCPVVIDTSDPKALEAALRRVNGRALVNSVNGTRKSMDTVFPVVKRYGGAMIALCLDESGIPATPDGRIAVARRILGEGAKYGFAREDFVFDALTLAVSADPMAAKVTLETVRRLADELKVNTVLGVSNVSFGLPDRPALNDAMYTLAKRAGLSAAIANPSALKISDDEAAFRVLLGRDANCAAWIAAHTAPADAPSAPVPAVAPGDAAAALRSAVASGLKADASAAAGAMLAAGAAAMAVVEDGIIPALEQVGRGFEQGKVYLPQLLMCADAAGEAFAVVRKALPANAAAGAAARPPIVLATVQGDIHDIGKNIVRALLENYGFSVVDLGRDVAPEAVVEAVRRSGAALVGLSALMTTTVGAMAETIRQLRAAKLECRVCVGGAVVTQEYADSIGADFYAKDAMRTVRIAENVCGK